MWDSREHAGSRHAIRLKHTASRSLYGYWNRLRGGRPAPLRREIEPADIGHILSDTFILEALDDKTYRYRLAGSRVCACFGHELKGESWLEDWAPNDQEALSTLLRSIVIDATGAAILFTGHNGRGQSAPFETLLLPLTNRGKGYTRILGATVPLDEPYWLGAHPLTDLDATSLDLIWPNDDSPLKPGSPHGPQESALPLMRKRHLALYDGGRTD